MLLPGTPLPAIRPLPTAPAAAGFWSRMLHWRQAPGRRLAFSLRAGAAVSLPVLAGWLAADTAAGMMAAIGGLSALYCGGRPYRSRALGLGLVVLAFALSVALGHAVGQAWPLAVVPVVALIAMLATWLCNALQVGPPGAYLFMLACAAGSAMPAAHLGSGRVMLLVAAGGALAWLLHMAGALWRWHGPERAAVRQAGQAVHHYLQATAADGELERRLHTSRALHAAWQTLVAYQPRRTAADSTLARLRGLNHQWHRLFAEVIGQRQDRAAALARAALLARALDDPAVAVAPWQQDTLPQGRPGIWQVLGEALAAGTPSRQVVVRVGVAALLAGTLAYGMALERAYWAIAAAVLILHAGLDWPQAVLRGAQRVLGTLAGLALTAAVLWWHPQGPWLAALVFALQFSVEMLVVRNYLLAAMFITTTGMLLACGGVVPADPAGYLLARGLDTLLGCGIALAVLRLMPVRSGRGQLEAELQRCLQALAELNSHLAWAELGSAQARALRARVSHRSQALAQAWEQAAGERERVSVAGRWATVAAVQDLAYRMLATAWSLEAQPVPGQARAEALVLYGPHGVARVQAALRQLQRGLVEGRGSEPPPGLPAFLAPQLHAVWQSLPARPG